MKTRLLSLLCFFLLVLFLFLEVRSSFTFVLIVKALIIPSLMVLLRVNTGSRMTNLHYLILAGLFFSWAGDITLEFAGQNGNMFIIGLVCFLFAHIMYFAVFLLTPGKNVVLNIRPYLLVPVLFYGSVLLYYLYDDLGNMRIPVILYSAVILTMLAGAINRIEKVGRASYYMVLTGAILFVISDSSIAINRFSHRLPCASAIIMGTYVIAQYLIIMGYINQFRKDYE
jgi:uncharacterized membrane protein YhhN